MRLISATFLLLALVTSDVLAGTITASATGSAVPSTATWPTSVANGDFLIEGNSSARTVGDGVDELTSWTFDFTGHAGYSSFSLDDPLESAVLTLTLTTMSASVRTDRVWIDGLAWIETGAIRSLPWLETSTTSLDLLDFYTSAEILAVLETNGGEVRMFYHDDSIVFGASLSLTSSVPLPPAALTGLSLLAGLGLLRRRRSR